MTFFKAVTFTGKKTADKVVDKIEKSPTAYIWEEEGDFSIISVNHKGHIRVHSTWAQDSRLVPGEVGFGAIAGGLIGLLLGPGGALAGAAIGGSIGGLLGHHENVKLDDPKLDAFATSLVKDSSAILLLGPKSAIEEFSSELAELVDIEFEVFESELNQAAIEELKKAMKK